MIVLVQNDPVVPPGLYGAHLEAMAVPHRVVRLDLGEDLPPVEDSRGVIVLGGYMSVEDDADYAFLGPLQEWMRQLAGAGIPLLGICLGGQLLARALGGQVDRDRRGERGIHRVHLLPHQDDPLLACLPESFPCLQWHRDSFLPPPDAELLASSDICPGQLFRAGRYSYGLQFHPEVNLEIVTAWNRRAGLDPSIPEQFRALEAEIRQPALQLLDNFLSLCN